ncbi:MAG: HAD family hydrolase [Anaerolineae bacterium]|nr:MAG: HAD family hydrolase [Anaerolineae bacterium]
MVISLRHTHIVFFDLGNTLLYFNADWPQVFLQAQEGVWEALVQSGVHLERQTFLHTLRQALKAYYQKRETDFIEQTTTYVLTTVLKEQGYPHLPDAVIQQALRRMYATTQAYWQVDAQAHEVLHNLKSRGFHLGLISNAAHDEDVQTLVDKHALREYFDVILTSAAAGIRKPNPHIFTLALKHWGCPPTHAVMVGDTLGADILGAHNAGMPAIWVTRYADRPSNHAHIDTIIPEASVEELRALLPLLPAPNSHASPGDFIHT